MPLDGIALRGVSEELNLKLAAARIDRVFQPFPHAISLELRQQGVSRRLYITAHTQYPRLHLSELKQVNPAKPPQFCQLLRKTLEGARIERIVQPGYERVVEIQIQGRDELGNPALYLLIVELLGKFSNIILANSELRILDAIKHISPTQSRGRELRPGAIYLPPPRPERHLPEEWQAPHQENFSQHRETTVLQWLGEQLEGFSPASVKAWLQLCRLPEALRISYLRLEDWLLLQATLYDLIRQRPEGMLYLHDPENALEVTAFPYPGLPPGEWFTASEALEMHYSRQELQLSSTQLRNRLNTLLKAARDKGLRKLNALNEDWDNAQDAEHLRIWGELLKTAPEPERRLGGIELVNYYDEEFATILIPLDQRFTILQNAQNYFKRYGKMHTARRLLGEQLANVEQELSYLATVQLAVAQSESMQDLQEITAELTEQGFIPKEKDSTAKNRAKDAPLPPLSYMVEGVEVLVGRNNRQNEEVTWRLARSEELWLHTKDIPGSHLLIRSSNPSNSVLEKSARLAAWHSQARESGLVPVDITQRRFLKKPRGARPGFVTYTNQRTVYVTPGNVEE